MSAKSIPKLRFSVPTNVFYNCRESSTNRPFLKNKANLRKVKMNVRSIITRDYGKIQRWTFGENKPNQSQFSSPQMGRTEVRCRLPELILRWTTERMDEGRLTMDDGRQNRILFGKRLLFSLRRGVDGVRINKNWCERLCMCLSENESGTDYGPNSYKLAGS